MRRAIITRTASDAELKGYRDMLDELNDERLRKFHLFCDAVDDSELDNEPDDEAGGLLGALIAYAAFALGLICMLFAGAVYALKFGGWV